MPKKIIHRSPTQVIYEDGTSKRFKRTPKTEKLAGEPIRIPVRDEDVEAFNNLMEENHKDVTNYLDRSKAFREEMEKPPFVVTPKERERKIRMESLKLKESWKKEVFRRERNKWLQYIIISIVLGCLLGLLITNI